MDNFADHPESLAEVKSDKSGKAKDWTPRDCLISLLREIDSGKAVITIGLIEFVKNLILNQE